jgi:hypothetical protein
MLNEQDPNMPEVEVHHDEFVALVEQMGMSYLSHVDWPDVKALVVEAYRRGVHDGASDPYC